MRHAEVTPTRQVRVTGATYQLAQTLGEELGQPMTEVFERAIHAWYHLYFSMGPVPGLHVGTPTTPVLDRHWLLDQVDRRVAFLKGDDHAA